MSCISIFKKVLMSEWLAIMVLALSLFIAINMFVELLLITWIKIDGTVVQVTVVTNEIPTGSGTDAAGISRSRCWLVGVEYQVAEKIYVTARESINSISTRCDDLKKTWPVSSLPQIGQRVTIWHDQDAPANAVLKKVTPWINIALFLISSAVALLFGVYLVRRVRSFQFSFGIKQP